MRGGALVLPNADAREIPMCGPNSYKYVIRIREIRCQDFGGSNRVFDCTFDDVAYLMRRLHKASAHSRVSQTHRTAPIQSEGV